jgi:hypothetical protein
MLSKVSNFDATLQVRAVSSTQKPCHLSNHFSAAASGRLQCQLIWWTCVLCRQWHAEIVSQYRRILGFPTHDETSTSSQQIILLDPLLCVVISPVHLRHAMALMRPAFCVAC